jgi:hypothetical protein
VAFCSARSYQRTARRTQLWTRRFPLGAANKAAKLFADSVEFVTQSWRKGQ